MRAANRGSKISKTLWLCLGILATGCGMVGIVLPLVPTTPFLLLAAAAFMRSSPALHAWLIDHPRLGPPLANWRLHGAIARRTKVLAITLMGVSLLGTGLAGVAFPILLLQSAVLMGAAAFILTRPDGPTNND